MEHALSGLTTTPPRTLSGLQLDPMLPLTGGLDGDQHLHLMAREGLAQYLMAHPSIGFSWIDELAPVAITIDMAAVEWVDSVLLGWLLRLRRSSGTTPLTLIGLSLRLRAQLELLRLGQVFTIA